MQQLSMLAQDLGGFRDHRVGARSPRSLATPGSRSGNLGNLLRLFHPLLPFITEELWHGMGFSTDMPADQGGKTIMFAHWPKPLDDDEKAHFGLDEAAVLTRLDDTSPAELTSENELWALVLEAARLDEVVEQVIRTLEFSVLAKYAFSLAQSFNGFYNLPPSRSSILNEERADVQRWRAAAVIYVRNQLSRALDLMGVEIPPRM